jgi:hypothetical protein
VKREYLIGVAIGAITAVVASAISATAVIYVAKTTLSAELRRDREREATQAAGAARLLSAELVNAAIYMNVMVNDRRFRRFDRNYRVELPQDDLRLLFTYLTPNEWGVVMLSMSAAQQLESYVRSRMSDGARRLTPRDVRIVRNDYSQLLNAAETLKRPADAEDLDLDVLFVPPEALPG